MDLGHYNASQREAICHGSGPALVLAGPGSGKTSVLTKRLQYLITEYHIPPEKILVVTFTKAAAGEMQQRFYHLMEEKLPVCFGTFHSVFYRILQEYHKNDPLTILTEKEKTEILKEILQMEGIDESYLVQFLEYFTQIKNTALWEAGETEDGISQERIWQIFERFRRFCKERGKVEFDDMAYECFRLFEERMEIRKKWQNRFSYLLVDEYQDIAPIQEKVLQFLAMPENNLFVVGDDDQTIYGFRGADTGCMLDFPKRYKGTKQIFLEMNYRSRPGIVEAASLVISKNKERFLKKQKAAREEGEKEAVTICGFENKKEEYDQILRLLKENKEEGKLKKCAVLYRKKKDADLLIYLLEKEEIPYVWAERNQSLKTHFITEDITAYLRLIDGDRTRKNFYQIMNRPQRGLDRACCPDEKISFSGLRGGKKLLEDCERAKDLSLFARVMYIRKGFGYEKWLFSEKVKKDGGQIKKEEYQEILCLLMEKAKQFSGRKEWEEWLTDSDEEKEKERKKKSGKKTGEDGKAEDAVTILTYHGCKGLEFDHVFLPDLNEGIVPHKKAVKEKEIEEERRMFYVAMTRAKETLHLYYLTGTKEEPETMSRFLHYSSSSTSSSNSALSRYSSKASATISYSSSSSI